jgi:hypothetical protein
LRHDKETARLVTTPVDEQLDPFVFFDRTTRLLEAEGVHVLSSGEVRIADGGTEFGGTAETDGQTGWLAVRVTEHYASMALYLVEQGGAPRSEAEIDRVLGPIWTVL